MLTTLVLSAGNLHGVMFVGAYKCLHDAGLLLNVRDIIGCSIGSVVGLMICLCYTPEEMEEILRSFVVKEGIPSIGMTSFLSLWNSSGLASSSFLKKYVREILAKKHVDTDITFADFAKKTGKNLVVVASNITCGCAESFSFTKNPRMSIVEAISISCTIPILMKPVKYNDNYYVDGAALNYLPTDLIEDDLNNALALYIKWKNEKFSLNLFNFVRNILSGIFKILLQEKTIDNMCTFESTIEGNAFKLTWFGGKNVKIEETTFVDLVKYGKETMQTYLTECDY